MIQMDKAYMPKVIIVDDHDIFRSGVRSMLTLDNIADVIAEASNGKDFLNIIDSYKPDVILMDIDMPEMNGVETTKKALEKHPELNILVLTMFGEEKYYYQMIESGAKGFILKSSNKAELEKAIHKIYSGGSYFSNDLLRQIILKIGSYKSVKSKKNQFVTFTERELEVVRLICKGLSTQEISNELNLSPKTVENYRTKILQKSKCKNSVQLVVYALKNGIVEI